MRTSLRTCAASLLMLFVAVCHGEPAAAPDTASLLKKIQAAASDTSCEKDAQCQTIGVGSKACGGPERYLVWSSQYNEGGQLKELVQQYAEARRADDARNGTMSTCTVVSDPGSLCSAGRCVLKKVRPGMAQASPQQ